MGMYGEADVFGLSSHFDRQRRLRDKIAGVGPDDAAADQPLGLFVPQGLGQAVVAPEGERAAARGPWEDRLAVFDTLCLELRLERADPGVFGIGVRDRRYHFGVEGGFVAACNLRRDLALMRAFVGEHRLADDVADGEDMRNIGAHLAIDRDEAALVDSHASRLGADPLAVRTPA